MDTQQAGKPLTPEEVAQQTGGQVINNAQTDDFDAGYERPPSNYIKWGKIGDVIKGTYVGKFEQISKTGVKQTVYEIEVEAGYYHNIKEIPEGSRNYVVDDKATELVAGEIYNVGGKKIIDNIMRRAKIGQRVLMRYIGNFATPAGNAKTVETKLGAINQNFLNSLKSEQSENDMNVDNISFN